ncbi:MAG TPA: hypothetical protein VLA99_00680 [Nitrospiraceae bacterium]|nr:hypothetical protein [Nitrospiraceae bacterium]
MFWVLSMEHVILRLYGNVKVVGHQRTDRITKQIRLVSMLEAMKKVGT